MKSGYYISTLIEEHLHHNVSVVVYHYISGVNYHRYIDSFRGNLDTCFSMGLIAIKSYIFLVNFLCWLENKTQFSDIEDNAFRYFYDDIIKLSAE